VLAGTAEQVLVTKEATLYFPLLHLLAVVLVDKA
jgi:hypothetical protein